MAASGETVDASQAGIAARTALSVFVPFALGYFISYVFRTVNSVIAPDLAADAGINAADLGLLTSAFFLAFAGAQLPLGMLLDRFGPRRVEAVLLVFAALGCLVFAAGDSLASLASGRALIGLGVSACMMASFKAFVLWFPANRLPLINGLLLAAGATGAIAATAPVEWLLLVTDWRSLFVGLAVAALAVAAALMLVVPEHDAPVSHLGLRDQVAGVRTVFRDDYFWRLAPLTVCSQATFLAVQGLWAGPWLRDVAGLARVAVAWHLMALGVAIVAGFLLTGLLAERLGRRGIRPGSVAAGGMGFFIVVQLCLVTWPSGPTLLLWLGFGVCGTAGMLSYASLSQHFHGQLAGRANTALNVLVFLGAFSVQWGMGALIHLWEDMATRTYGTQGYRWSFAVMIVLQLTALAWYAGCRRKGAR